MNDRTGANPGPAEPGEDDVHPARSSFLQRPVRITSPISGEKLRAGIIIVAAAAALAMAAGVWFTAITHHNFDYDEIEHAHATWLVAQGRTPFIDFLEVHPPFAWWILAPLTRVVRNTVDLLLVLRALSAVGSAVMIALL